ncbi:MAG: hypothetical protein V5A45_15820 [Haloarculaceae archaeon]
MDLQQLISGWVLFVVGVAGLGVSWVLTGPMAAGIGLLSVASLAVGVLIIGTGGSDDEVQTSG